MPKKAPNWGEGVPGIRAGRDMAKEIIEANQSLSRDYRDGWKLTSEV